MKTLNLTIFDDDNCEVEVTMLVSHDGDDFSCSLLKSPSTGVHFCTRKTNMTMREMEAKAVDHLRIYPEKYFGL